MLVQHELEKANAKFPQFASDMDGWAVLKEEIEEAKEELDKVIAFAQRMASEAGMLLKLVDLDAWQFRLSCPAINPEWAIDLWPCVTGEKNRERIKHDLSMPRRGPRLYLRRYWTIVDAVQAAIDGVNGESSEGRAPSGDTVNGRW